MIILCSDALARQARLGAVLHITFSSSPKRKRIAAVKHSAAFPLDSTQYGTVQRLIIQN